MPAEPHAGFEDVRPWVDGLTIPQALLRTASDHASRDALVFPGRNLRLTYRQLSEQVDIAARALAALGINRGDHVALWATNVPEWVVLQFATARIGAILVTINPAYRPYELHFVLKQSDAKAIFLVERFKTSDYFAMIAGACPELAQSTGREIDCAEFPKLRRVVSLESAAPQGALAWPEFLAMADRVSANELNRRTATLAASDAINVQYTSGTTGFPKAATLSHRNLLLNAYYIGKCQRYSADDRICIPVPFYHCFGCVLGTLCAAVYGAAMVVPAESFQAEATLTAIAAERATSIYGVPTMFIAQLNHPKFAQYDLSSLRTGVMAGSPCPIEVMRQVVDRMGAREITIGYGQTEASPIITQTRFDDPLKLRVETVGRPMPGIEVKIVDPATGHVLSAGDPGELCCRGHNVMLGYYHDPLATSAAIDSEGWLHTGDLAIRLPENYYKITGRLKDMVIRGGENIFPREIEEFLFHHPAIEQAAVFGVPDVKYGEELCVWIKLREGHALTEKEVHDYCRSQLAHYKSPRYVRFVDSFPQTVTGKIKKFVMRETMCRELGLCEEDTA